jgi:hypothetical protein
MTNNSAIYVLTNVAGCDSTITLNLTINSSTVSTDVQLACGDYTWIDGNTSTSRNNTATYLLTTAAGCDSTISLDLTITTIDNSTTQLTTTITATMAGASYQWLNCENYAPIAGATGQSFTAVDNGDCAVEITINGCVDTSACANITGIGALESDFGQLLNVYPNPTAGHVIIDFGTTHDCVTVQVFAVDRHLVMTQQFNSTQLCAIDIDGVPGFYMV